MTTYKNFASAHWRTLIAGVAVGVLLTGCAMTPNGRGGVMVGLDTAELFGTPISTFRLRAVARVKHQGDIGAARLRGKLGRRLLQLCRIDVRAQQYFKAQAAQALGHGARIVDGIQ